MAVTHGARRRLDQMRRRAEPKGYRVADIQVANTSPLSLDCLRFRDDVADRVRESVDSPGDRHGAGISCGHLLILRAAADSGEPDHASSTLSVRRETSNYIVFNQLH